MHFRHCLVLTAGLLAGVADALTAGLLAAAADAPTVDMTRVLVDDRAAPIGDSYGRDAADQASDPDCKKCAHQTIGLAAAHALNHSTMSERETMEAGQKWARSALAASLVGEKAAKLSSVEVETIKKAVAKLYSGAIIMQLFPALDPNAKPAELK